MVVVIEVVGDKSLLTKKKTVPTWAHCVFFECRSAFSSPSGDPARSTFKRMDKRQNRYARSPRCGTGSGSPLKSTPVFSRGTYGQFGLPKAPRVTTKLWPSISSSWGGKGGGHLSPLLIPNKVERHGEEASSTTQPPRHPSEDISRFSVQFPGSRESSDCLSYLLIAIKVRTTR